MAQDKTRGLGKDDEKAARDTVEALRDTLIVGQFMPKERFSLFRGSASAGQYTRFVPEDPNLPRFRLLSRSVPMIHAIVSKVLVYS